jgi:hypothetical protein
MAQGLPAEELIHLSIQTRTLDRSVAEKLPNKEAHQKQRLKSSSFADGTEPYTFLLCAPTSCASRRPTPTIFQDACDAELPSI